MSLARAFTTRRVKKHSIDLKDSLPQRSNTTAKGHAPSLSIRNKISSPMELTHTTNMLAYNAPDLYPKSAKSTSSRSFSDDSDAQTNTSSPPTSPDVPSAADRSLSPEPNHLSVYFTTPSQKPSAPINDVPVVPNRAPSHTKKASFEKLTKAASRLSGYSGKSVSAKSSFSLSRSSSTSTTATSVSGYTHLKSPVPSMPAIPAEPSLKSSPTTRQMPLKRPEAQSPQHPFGNELAQVSEIAEEFGLNDKLQVIDEEEQDLISRGLCVFRPEDYLSEVQGLFSTFFKPEPRAAQPVWI